MVILNPYAGRGRGARIKAPVQQALSAAGIAYDYSETTAQGQGIELAHQARTDGYSTIVAVGGDGTVNEVINGLARACPPDQPVGKLAIVSVGSGNDFAHTLGIAQDPTRAVQAIGRGATRLCDLGHVVIQTRQGASGGGTIGAGATIERYFNNNFGIGLDPQVTLESFKISWLSGVALYGLAALRALWKYQAPALHLRWETENGTIQERDRPILLASVGNAPRSGGGFHLTPNARIDDGLLDLVMADAMPRWQVLRLLPKAIPGKHLGDPAVTLVLIRTLQISAPQPFPLELDGEVVTQSAERLEMTVQPSRLEVIV
jgi:YegS/Rv2252/BmrU family lipid kinase